ncbi:calcium-binding protein [Laspinema palackyanum]|uniref:calcium-binding protein n=1 Tax=Laspinema palackyanum TaxID=3231601 RepID=UPI00345DB71B|nr:calcium-binding protein [Laspinema sp. D2c]
MRILFTLAHFFNPDGIGKYGAQRDDSTPRIQALTQNLTALHQLFGNSQYATDYANRVAISANQSLQTDIEIVICTTQGYHILDRLPLPSHLWTHHPTNAEPLLLGFECQALLRERLGGYDYYCFLEDDLILQDPWFFIKLNWFTQQAGDRHLLQPNRYEQSTHPGIGKTYIDGELHPKITASYQNVHEHPQLTGMIMGTAVTFHRTCNPHSGCYFLNARQMEYWVQQPYFLDRDTRFVGPLESAATLGIMRTFKVYKPAPPMANFLEVQHFGRVWSEKISQLVRWQGDI